METEKLEEVQRHCGRSANGIQKDSPPQAISSLDLISDDDSEASDNITEKEPEARYIPIRRNSIYYRSIRLQNRKKVRSSKEVQMERFEGTLKNGNTTNELLNKEELLRIFHKSLSLHVKPKMTATEEQWFQREIISTELVNLWRQIVSKRRWQ